MIERNSKYWFFSVLLHGLVLGLFITYLHSPTVVDSSFRGKIVSAYIYHGSSSKPSYTKPKSTQQPAQPQSIIPAQKGIEKRVPKKIMATLPNSAAAKNSVSIMNDAFLELLHNLIQAHQHYPRNALVMGRKGIVTVSFKLFTDGHIEDLKMLESSQTDSLDQAALEAIREAAPIKEAMVYLKQSKVFTIHIDFE